jgi:hypothetical protein
MNQRQTNVLNMYKGILNYMNTYTDVWNDVELITEQHSTLNDTIALLGEKVLEQQQKDPAGYTKAKKEALNRVVSLAYIMALKLKSYAKATDNAVLLQKVQYSDSNLERGSESEVINRCSLIAAAAAEHLEQMTAYRLTEGSINELKGCITLVKAKIAERDVVTGERVSITSTLPQLFRQAQEQIANLDDLIRVLIDESKRDFISGYFAIRRVNNRRGGPRRRVVKLQEEKMK